MTTIRDNPDLPAALWKRYATGPWAMPFLVMTGVGLLGSIIGLIVDRPHFLFTWLAAWTFVWSLVMGMMFLVMLHHLTDAGWSTVIRRPAEQCLAALPALAILFLPVFLGMSVLFRWTGETVESDPMMAVKQPFLNQPFFILRAILYFAVWFMLARKMRGQSLRQDHTADPQCSFSMRRWSAPGMILYALTFTFASIDWLMTLDHHWYSTIFGVLIYAGGTVAAIALLSILTLRLAAGPLRGRVANDHIHDLGKLLFAFAVFWAYIAFSQWFLIWYANIPEETGWMLARWAGSWRIVTIIMVTALFLIPFVVLMPAGVKSNRFVLTAISAIVLAGHYLQMIWIVMPQVHPEGWRPAYLWIDAAALLLVLGIAGGAVRAAMRQAPLYPINDPRLHEVMHAVEHETHQTGHAAVS